MSVFVFNEDVTLRLKVSPRDLTRLFLVTLDVRLPRCESRSVPLKAISQEFLTVVSQFSQD